MHPILVCPQTKQRLRELSVVEAERLLIGGSEPQRWATSRPQTYPAFDRVLVREDDQAAYAIVEGVPILLAPEMLSKDGHGAPIDTSLDPYREAYEEMAFYDSVAEGYAAGLQKTDAYEMVKRAALASADRFPEPASAWLDATYDCAAQRDAYSYLAPVKGRRVMQLGGTGIHAVKFLLAGAAESWLLTPMLAEALFALELAAEFGVGDGLYCAVGLGEEMPFLDGSFARVFAGGCLHHTITSMSVPEIRRVLDSNGRFAAVEPWKAPLYGMGTKLLGKREVGVNCRPIDQARAEPLYSHFESGRLVHHGALSRYPLIALSKLGLKASLETVQRLTNVDDAVSNLVPLIRRQGSSVALLGSKEDSKAA